MAEAYVEDADCTDGSSELIVATVPQEQGQLVCIQYPGTASYLLAEYMNNLMCTTSYKLLQVLSTIQTEPSPA